jgi:hypothetical protein
MQFPISLYPFVVTKTIASNLTAVSTLGTTYGNAVTTYNGTPNAANATALAVAAAGYAVPLIQLSLSADPVNGFLALARAQVAHLAEVMVEANAIVAAQPTNATARSQAQVVQQIYSVAVENLGRYSTLALDPSGLFVSGIAGPITIG